MPIYSFRCRSCGREFEELVSRMGQNAPCPQCGGTEVERLLTLPAAPHGSTAAAECPVRPGFS